MTTLPSPRSSVRWRTCPGSAKPMSLNLRRRKCTYGKPDVRSGRNAAAHGQPVPAPAGPGRIAGADREPRWRPCHRGRHRRPGRGHDRRPCRLLRCRHEPVGQRVHYRQRRHRRGREHDERQGPRQGLRLQCRRRHGARRAAGDRRGRRTALRHLAQGRRCRRRRFGRQFLGLHGTGRQSGGSGRRRPGARGLAVWGPHLRARHGQEPGRRLRGKAHRRQRAPDPGRSAAPGRPRPGRSRVLQALRLRPQALQLPCRQCRSILSMTAATQPSPDSTARTPPRFSASFDPAALAEIRRAAATGIYDIRGAGTKRRLPHFDDLLFLGASISRYPLEGYREKCGTDVMLGTRFARKPIHLKTPVTIAGMSFGALSAHAKDALGRGASLAGTSTTTGDGGMTPEERGQSKTLVYQYLPSRYGMNPDDLRKADAIEVVVGQGAKPGGGGMLLGQKISDRVAEMRTLPKGIDQRSACRHPDWTGPDDLEIKILELREITDWEKPIYIKVGGARPYYDTALAVKAGADVVVLDGMQGGTAATQDVFIENVGMPTLACIRPAVQALQDLGMHRKVQLIISGGIRSGADVAKALALGADAVSIGTAALVAIGDNDPHWEAEYQKLGPPSGAYDDWHEGKDPAGITTQDPELASRLDPVVAGRRLANYLKVMTLEAQTIARACGKNHLHNLEPEDLCALTMEAAAMAQIPLAGTNWYPGKGGF